MDALGIVQHHLMALAHTAATREFERHMALYSRNVDLYGVPGRDVLGYDDIATRRRTEFERGLLLRIAFSAPEILSVQRGVITYRITERLKCTNGSALVLDKDVTINEEHDGKWRTREERISRAQIIPPEKDDPLL